MTSLNFNCFLPCSGSGPVEVASAAASAEEGPPAAATSSSSVAEGELRGKMFKADWGDHFNTTPSDASSVHGASDFLKNFDIKTMNCRGAVEVGEDKRNYLVFVPGTAHRVCFMLSDRDKKLPKMDELTIVSCVVRSSKVMLYCFYDISAVSINSTQFNSGCAMWYDFVWASQQCTRADTSGALAPCMRGALLLYNDERGHRCDYDDESRKSTEIPLPVSSHLIHLLLSRCYFLNDSNT